MAAASSPAPRRAGARLARRLREPGDVSERTATEIGVFAEGDVQPAIMRLQESAVAPEDIGVITDPRKAREVVGTRARQLVGPLALAGAVAGIVLLLLVPGGDPGYRTSPAAIAVWALGGLMAGILVGALAGKTLPRRDPAGYERRVERGEVLVTVKVEPTDRWRVRHILASAGARNLGEERTAEAP